MEATNNLSHFKKPFRTIILLLIFSFAVKALLLASRWVILRAEGMFYVSIARHIFAGEIKEAFLLSAQSYLPFYPVIIAGLHLIIKDWALAAQLVSFFSGSLAVIPFYLLIRDIFDERIAIISSLFFIVSPDINFISTGIGSDGLFLLLSLLSLWVLWMSYKKGKILYAGISFFFVFSATLTRIEGVVFFPLYFFWIVYFNRENTKRLLIIGIASLLLIISTVYLGLIYYKYIQIIPFKVSLIGYIFKDLSFLKLQGVAEELRKSEQIIPYGQYFDFFEIARHYMHIIYLIGLVDALVRACGYAVFPFILVGLFGRMDKTKGYGRSYLLSAFLIYAMMNYLYLLNRNYVEARYLIPGIVALFPWSGIGYIKIETYLKERVTVKNTVIAVVIGLVVFSATGYKFHSMWKSSLANKHIVEAGRWTQYSIPSRSIIFTNIPTVPFSAEKSYIEVQCADMQQCMDKALRESADYLIYDSIEKSEVFTSFTPIKVFYGVKDDILIFKIDK